ncbi:MAG: hypothetical protein ACLUVF_06250 [Adlercreutzia sp.]
MNLVEEQQSALGAEPFGKRGDAHEIAEVLGFADDLDALGCSTKSIHHTYSVRARTPGLLVYPSGERQ